MINVALILAAAITATACQPRQAVLVIGQSNAGGGTTTERPAASFNIWNLATSEWVPYVAGKTNQYNGGTFGPELTLAQSLGVDVIKIAVGNTSISPRQGVDRPLWRDELLAATLAAIDASGAQVVGVLWSQGEADALTDETAAAYAAAQAQVLATIIAAVGDVPLVVTKPRRGGIERQGHAVVRQAISQNASRLNYRVLDLNHYPSSDGTHLTDDGFKQLGLDAARLILRSTKPTSQEISA